MNKEEMLIDVFKRFNASYKEENDGYINLAKHGKSAFYLTINSTIEITKQQYELIKEVLANGKSIKDSKRN